MDNNRLQFIGRVIDELLNQGLIFRSPWLTSRQAAGYCQLSESYLNSLRSRNAGPDYIKKGKVCLYHKDHLDSWLMQGIHRGWDNHG